MDEKQTMSPTPSEPPPPGQACSEPLKADSPDNPALEQQNQQAKTRLSVENSPGSLSASAMAQGLRMANVFIGAIGAGLLLGWGLDTLVGSAPWMQVCGSLIGFGGGVWGLIALSSVSKQQE